VPRRRLVLVLLVLLVFAVGGCGGDDGSSVAKRAGQSLEHVKDEIAKKIGGTLDKIERAIPAAGRRSQPPRRGNLTMEEFLTAVLKDVDAYWTETLTSAGLPKPRVAYVWIPPGQKVRTGCGHTADDTAAFYCGADDTIYVAEKFAAGVLQGVLDNLPGEQVGAGRAIGDFGVAYVIAHEYAHNIQTELGWFRLAQRLPQVTPLELQADCMAGAWGNSAYRQGKLDRGDVQEALSTAAAVGDFEFMSPQHHGTPEERVTAWLRGYENGSPAACTAYLGV
jgi:predicted metalloprotease